MKKICSIHRFTYGGNLCPFCERERINGLVRRFVKNDNVIVKNREITEEDLQQLLDKFNNGK